MPHSVHALRNPVRPLHGIMGAMLGAAALAGTAQAATKVACVGDSITRGAGTTMGAYPVLLGRMLGAGFEVGKFGNSGSTMMKSPTDSYWISAEFTASKAFAPNIVVIMLGTNDAKGSWGPADGPHNFEPDYRAMVAEYAALPSKPKIYVVLPPPMVRPTLKTAEAVLTQQVIPIIRRIASDTMSGLVNVHDAFCPDPTKYFGAGDGVDIGDGLHPNDAGARLIAETVLHALQPGRVDAGVAAPKCPASPAPRDAGADRAADGAAGDGPADALDADAANTGADRPVPPAKGEDAAVLGADAAPMTEPVRRPDGAGGGSGGAAGRSDPPITDPEIPPSTPGGAPGGCTCGVGGSRAAAPSWSALALAALACGRRIRRRGNAGPPRRARTEDRRVECARPTRGAA